MIKRFVVNNLYGQFDYDLTFHQDVNILTGKNGVGKTTLLKLIWYMVSGNVNKIFEEEIEFSLLRVEFLEENKSIEGFVELTMNKYEKNLIVSYIGNDTDLAINMKISGIYSKIKERIEKEALASAFNSMFFPTFRRIEGGYGIEKFSLNENIDPFLNTLNRTTTTKYSHNFIFAISTNDIVHLIQSKYADIAKTVNDLNTEQSNYILSLTENSTDVQENIVALIQKKVKEGKEKKEELFLPITLLSNVLAEVFENKGIKITEHISMGKESPIISPEKLSSGEKQMLSFLSYNAFYQDTVFFIDEPELSLHTDWQRLLVPTLLQQTKTNQFFLATHSSAIAARYPDKEIWLDKLNQKGGK